MVNVIKILSFLLCCFIIHGFPNGWSLPVEAKEINLPQTVGVWSKPTSPQIVNSNNIFKYMDGAGELYIGYRFHHLEVFEYQSQKHETLLVELYFMQTPDDAFGLLSLDWGGESVNLNRPPVHQTPPAIALSSRALYGGGLLRISVDHLYARVMASRETPASKLAVLALGEAIVSNQKRHPEPELLKKIPLQIDSGWKLRQDRLSYFRSYLVLNSIYYLSQGNILDLDLSTEAVMAPYEHGSGAKAQKRPRLLLIKYENHARARKALNHFQRTYLPEHKGRFTAESATKNPNLFQVEDGWMGYKLTGLYVVIVFESPYSQTVKTILHRIEINLVKKGG